MPKTRVKRVKWDELNKNWREIFYYITETYMYISKPLHPNTPILVVFEGWGDKDDMFPVIYDYGKFAREHFLSELKGIRDYVPDVGLGILDTKFLKFALWYIDHCRNCEIELTSKPSVVRISIPPTKKKFVEVMIDMRDLYNIVAITPPLKTLPKKPKEYSIQFIRNFFKAK